MAVDGQGTCNGVFMQNSGAINPKVKSHREPSTPGAGAHLPQSLCLVQGCFSCTRKRQVACLKLLAVLLCH